MTPPDSDPLKDLVDAWNQASQALEIRVVAPCDTIVGNELVPCIAFLPDFGGPKGMLVGTCQKENGYETDQRLIKLAEAKKLYYSFITPETYMQYNEAAYKEALEDWGYFGTLENCPDWLRVKLPPNYRSS